MTKDEKIQRMKAEILHDKTCWYGANLCTYPGARAKRDLERLLGERITPHSGLDAEARECSSYGPTGE